MERINILKTISESNFYNLECEIMNAKYSIIKECYTEDKDIIIYIPEYIQQHISNNYFKYFSSGINTFCGMKVMIGYEDAVVVAHKETALRGFRVHKITLNK